jgi:hypothetical protein
VDGYPVEVVPSEHRDSGHRPPNELIPTARVGGVGDGGERLTRADRLNRVHGHHVSEDEAVTSVEVLDEDVVLAHVSIMGDGRGEVNTLKVKK